MRIKLVDGDEMIADSAVDGGFQGACGKFKAWVQDRFPPGA
jgi:hypothetical protein